MKATRLFFLSLPLLMASVRAEQQVYPTSTPDASYEKLKADWPFVLAKPAAEKEPEKASWAQDLWLSSVVMQRTGEGGEQPWVTIRNREQGFVQLTLNEEKDGMTLVKVENLDDPKKTTAVVKKNNEFATLKRDEAAFNSTAPVPHPGVRPGTPMRAGQPVPLQNAGNAIRMPGAQPAGSIPKAPGIPRPASAIPAPATGAAPATQGTQTDRKRIRVINSK